MNEKDKDYIRKKCEKQAELLVDTLFDKLLLNPKLKRKDARTIEKLIVLETYYQITSQIQWEELLKSITWNKHE